MPVAVSRSACVVAVALVLELAAAGSIVVARQPDPAPRQQVAVQAVTEPAPDPAVERTAAVRALLAARSAAVLAHDRTAFLAGIDPSATVFAQRQAAVFDALAHVPLVAWTYTLHPEQAQPDDLALDGRYGTWWAPRVVLGVGLDGVDADPAESEQALTFVEREGRWYVAADDDFAARGSATARQVWDEGPVVVVRGKHSLVLGHPDSLARMQSLADDVDAAVPRVDAVWGSAWPQTVAAVVPEDQAELSRLVTSQGGLDQIAALAVAGPVRGDTARGGDRLFVNPPALATLGRSGRRVVITHEVTHVATRSVTGSATPAWLREGFADHVGFLGAGIPVATAAQELRAEVRAGWVPTGLPGDADFDGDNPRLAAVYEQAWLAVELLVTTYGQDRVVALYRDLGARTAQAPGSALEQALRAQMGIGVADLTAAWQTSLRRRLS